MNATGATALTITHYKQRRAILLDMTMLLMEGYDSTQRHVRTGIIYFVGRNFHLPHDVRKIGPVVGWRQISRSICGIGPVVGIGSDVVPSLDVSPTLICLIIVCYWTVSVSVSLGTHQCPHSATVDHRLKQTVTIIHIFSSSGLTGFWFPILMVLKTLSVWVMNWGLLSDPPTNKPLGQAHRY